MEKLRLYFRASNCLRGLTSPSRLLSTMRSKWPDACGTCRTVIVPFAWGLPRRTGRGRVVRPMDFMPAMRLRTTKPEKFEMEGANQCGLEKKSGGKSQRH